jgi:hypothetical protein
MLEQKLKDACEPCQSTSSGSLQLAYIELTAGWTGRESASVASIRCAPSLAGQQDMEVHGRLDSRHALQRTSYV